MASRMVDEPECIRNAASLCRIVNNPNIFTESICLYAVSGSKELAEKPSAVKAVESVFLSEQEQHGSPHYESTEAAIKERCYEVWKLSKMLPNLHKFKLGAELMLSQFRARKLADIMRLIGVNKEEAGASGQLYKAIDRFIKKKEEQPPTTAALPRQIRLEIDVDDNHSSRQQRPRFSGESSISTLTGASPGNTATTTPLSSIAGKPKASSSASTQPAFVKLMTLPETRRTANEKQTARQRDQAWKDIHSISYKVGSIIYAGVQSGRFPLSKFSSAEKIAESLNDFFGMDTISAGDLRRSYSQGNTGKSPPRQGPPTRVDAVSFSLLAQLVFTCQTIEQTNCIPNRLSRPQVTAEVGAIVNAKLEADGQAPLNDVKFFERIQGELARETSVALADPRELLRATWLTHTNQDLNHINFENTLVKLGFGRLARSDAERKEHGNVVLFEGQAQRIIQIDEMGFSADGSKNGLGGRPASFMSNTNAPDAGTPVSKSSAKTSWLLGVNFADEPLPPLAIFTSSAVNPKFKGHYLRNMHQVEGIFGYPSKRQFSASFAASENGSITKDIIRAYIEETIVRLYPDVCDEDGKRVLIKLDSGPGRFYELFRTIAREYGIYTFPGVPNGTEIRQEMDQLFGNLKTQMEKSQRAIFQKRYAVVGAKAQVTAWDTAYVLFGGLMHFEDGSTLDLPNNFAIAMAPAHVQSAREKCGYIPATRASLKSAKLRHEMFVDGDGNADNDIDPCSLLLQQMEKQNAQAVEELTLRGFKLAKNLKRSVEKVTLEQQEARQRVVTVPNTKARREKLMWITHAGEWFKATNGGLPMNDDDAIIALEMQRLTKVAGQLEKRKKSMISRQEQIKTLNVVLALKGNDASKWTIAELKSMIKGKAPELPVSSKSRQELLTLWAKYKNKPLPNPPEWTEKNERQLLKAKSGDIDCIERTHLMCRAKNMKCEFLSIKLSTLPQQEVFKIIAHAVRERTNKEKGDLAKMLLMDAIELENLFYCDSDGDDSISTLDVASLMEDEDEEVDVDLDDDSTSKSEQQQEQAQHEQEEEEEEEEEEDVWRSESSSRESEKDPSTTDEEESEAEQAEQRSLTSRAGVLVPPQPLSSSSSSSSDSSDEHEDVPVQDQEQEPGRAAGDRGDTSSGLLDGGGHGRGQGRGGGRGRGRGRGRGGHAPIAARHQEEPQEVSPPAPAATRATRARTRATTRRAAN